MARRALGDALGDGTSSVVSASSGTSVASFASDFEEVRTEYVEAMRELSTWDFRRGHESVVRRFNALADAARECGDKNLECEACIIAGEVESNALRRRFMVLAEARARAQVDVAWFERTASLALRLASEMEDRISEIRAHTLVGDFHSLMSKNFEAAMEHYGLARAFAREENFLPLEVEACRRLRSTMRMRGDLDGAIVISREIVRLAKQYEARRRSGERTRKKATVPVMLRENWYFGGYENQEVYACMEHGCACRGESCVLERPIIVRKHQDEAVKAFKEADGALVSHWSRNDKNFESDSHGASIKLNILAHLGDVFDNDLELTSENHEVAVEYRKKYNDLHPGSFGVGVACSLCDKPLGGLSIADAPIRMTHAWSACQRQHHFHSACFEKHFERAEDTQCPGCSG